MVFGNYSESQAEHESTIFCCCKKQTNKKLNYYVLFERHTKHFFQSSDNGEASHWTLCQVWAQLQ